MTRPLKVAAQTAFANLQTAMSNLAHDGMANPVDGGFVSKANRHGQRFWYHQVRGALKTPRQTYLGPMGDPAVELAIERLRSAHQDPSQKHVRQLCRAAIALGCPALTPSHGRVIQRLAGAGFFRAGGVLIGTHAFLAYQTLLGVVWDEVSATTMDIDFAHPGRNVSLAMPREVANVDVHTAIESLRMGFLPNASSTTYVKADERDFELDFVTCRGRDGEEPLVMPSLNVTLQPLRFMEYSLEGVIETVLLTSAEPVAVRVPAPARYALHKLLIADERPAAQSPKTRKDRAQSLALIEVLEGSGAGDQLDDALENLLVRGSKWRSSVIKGLDKLSTEVVSAESASAVARLAAMAVEASELPPADRQPPRP